MSLNDPLGHIRFRPCSAYAESIRKYFFAAAFMRDVVEGAINHVDAGYFCLLQSPVPQYPSKEMHN
jgi:hypothetical protein